MDMATIEKRLKNYYYYSASDCMRVGFTSLQKLYDYNNPLIFAQTLHF